MTNKKVSVVIPAYNASRFLDKCLTSVISQEFDDMEIIAINDGSTDDTYKKLMNYKKDIIVIDAIKNIGAGGARNIGINEANGEFLYFVDVDDYIKPDCISTLYKAAIDNNISYVKTAIGKNWTINGVNIPFVNYIDRINVPTRGNKIINTRIYKSDIINDFGVTGRLIKKSLIGDLRFPENNRWEDLAVSPLLKAKAENIMHIDTPFYVARLHMKSSGLTPLTKRVNLLDMYDSLETLKNNFKDANLYEDYKDQLQSIYNNNMDYILFFASCWRMKKEDKIELINGLISLLNIENKNQIYYENNLGINIRRYIDSSIQTESKEEAVKVIKKSIDKYRNC